MAVLRSTIPRQLEISRQFEAQDLSESELKPLRERVLASDLEADLRAILGRGFEQLDFAEITWERFGQFVQRISEPIEFSRKQTQIAAPLEKTELTTQLRFTTGK
jgi:hypothetical protein